MLSREIVFVPRCRRGGVCFWVGIDVCGLIGLSGECEVMFAKTGLDSLWIVRGRSGPVRVLLKLDEEEVAAGN